MSSPSPSHLTKSPVHPTSSPVRLPHLLPLVGSPSSPQPIKPPVYPTSSVRSPHLPPVSSSHLPLSAHPIYLLSAHQAPLHHTESPVYPISNPPVNSPCLTPPYTLSPVTLLYSLLPHHVMGCSEVVELCGGGGGGHDGALQVRDGQAACLRATPTLQHLLVTLVEGVLTEARKVVIIMLIHLLCTEKPHQRLNRERGQGLKNYNKINKINVINLWEQCFCGLFFCFCFSLELPLLL